MITPALERLILHTLAQAPANVMTPEESLFITVNNASPTPVFRAMLSKALLELQDRQQVTGVTTDDGPRWRISPNGHARLQEINLAPRK